MKQEKLHDALNLLDDDIIEAVNALREAPKKRSLTWMHWVSLAASVCIVAGLVWLFPPVLDNTTVADGSCGTIEAPENGKPNKTENESIMSDSTTASAQVTVRIESFSEDGFFGTVTKEGIWDAGSQLRVVIHEKTAKNTTLTAGMEVTVQFAGSRRQDSWIIIYADQIWQEQDKAD